MPAISPNCKQFFTVPTPFPFETCHQNRLLHKNNPPIRFIFLSISSPCDIPRYQQPQRDSRVICHNIRIRTNAEKPLSLIAWHTSCYRRQEQTGRGVEFCGIFCTLGSTNSNFKSRMKSRRRGVRRRRRTDSTLMSRRRADEDSALIWNRNNSRRRFI